VDKAVAGDLVLVSAGSGVAAAMDTDRQQGEAGEAGSAAAAAAAGLEDESLLASSADRLAAVHVVTAEEAEQGVFSIDDVVLPLPGHKVVYPEHGTAAVYQEVSCKAALLLAGGRVGVGVGGKAGRCCCATAAAGCSVRVARSCFVWIDVLQGLLASDDASYICYA
jgi:hypothetical protein